MLEDFNVVKSLNKIFFMADWNNLLYQNKERTSVRVGLTSIIKSVGACLMSLVC